MGIEILDHNYTYQCCQHTIEQSKSWIRLRSIFPSLRDMFENSKTRIIYEGKYIGGDCHISLIGLKKFVQTREFHLPVQTMVKIHIIRIYLHIVYDRIVLWHKFEIVSQRKHTKPYHTRSLYQSTRWVKLVHSRKKYPKISYNELFIDFSRCSHLFTQGIGLEMSIWAMCSDSPALLKLWFKLLENILLENKCLTRKQLL